MANKGKRLRLQPVRHRRLPVVSSTAICLPPFNFYFIQGKCQVYKGHTFKYLYQDAPYRTVKRLCLHLHTFTQGFYSYPLIQNLKITTIHTKHTI